MWDEGVAPRAVLVWCLNVGAPLKETKRGHMCPTKRARVITGCSCGILRLLLVRTYKDDPWSSLLCGLLSTRGFSNPEASPCRFLSPFSRT